MVYGAPIGPTGPYWPYRAIARSNGKEASKGLSEALAPLGLVGPVSGASVGPRVGL